MTISRGNRKHILVKKLKKSNSVTKHAITKPILDS